MVTKVDKLLTALAGAASEALAAGLVPDGAKQWVVIALGVLTALGVYAVPNKPAA